jgi:hypothetical protein
MKPFSLSNDSFALLKAEQNNKQLMEATYLKGPMVPSQRSKINKPLGEYYFPSCNAVKFGETPLRFRRNVLSPSSGLKSKPNKTSVRSRYQRESQSYKNSASLKDHSFWLQIQRSWVPFPGLPHFLRSSGSGTGSTQPREDN